MKLLTNRDPCNTFVDSEKNYIACWDGKNGQEMWVELYNPYPKKWGICATDTIDKMLSTGLFIFSSNNIRQQLREVVEYYIQLYKFEFK